MTASNREDSTRAVSAKRLERRRNDSKGQVVSILRNIGVAIGLCHPVKRRPVICATCVHFRRGVNAYYSECAEPRLSCGDVLDPVTGDRSPKVMDRCSFLNMNADCEYHEERSADPVSSDEKAVVGSNDDEEND